MSGINVYGIANCDMTRKALDWFKKKQVRVQLHDYRVEGVNRSQLVRWCHQVGWTTLLNKKSTTWRALPAAQQVAVTDEATAIAAMMENSTLIKRPVVEINDQLIVGYNETYFTKP